MDKIKMSTINELYNHLEKNYTIKIVDFHDLKLKIMKILRMVKREQKDIIVKIIIQLTWLSSDRGARNDTTRLWYYPTENNKVRINLENLVPYTRRILDLFSDFYLSGRIY